MKKIAVVGLYTIKNMGDNLLCDATQYLIRQNNPKVRIVEVDVNPIAKKFTGLSKIPFAISKVMVKLSTYIFSYENASAFRYYYEYFMWWIKVNRRFKKSLKDVDAIVFAGGGFLKFRTQGLNYYVEQIIRIAAKKNIPVMMNGVGIEGYSETDIRCQRMKKMINHDCVKVITTRDDIDILRDNYITNPNIKISRVGDPALWAPECYHVRRKSHGETIGVNVIRGKVYQAYGNSLSEFQLLNFYKKLINGIEERGWDWVLFSNGMKADQVFGKRVLSALNCKDSKKLLNAPSNVPEFIRTLKEFKCVFGARLHACITSYALDVPVVGLIWNEKLQIFSEVIGKPDNFFSEDKLHIENILDAIERSFEDSYDTEIRDNLRNLTKSYVDEFMKLI